VNMLNKQLCTANKRSFSLGGWTQGSNSLSP